MVLVIKGDPKTKKNSPRVARCGMYLKVLPSKAYCEYEEDAVWQLKFSRNYRKQAGPVEVTCLYYMKTHRKVDLTNLEEATDDILVKAGILEDDNSDVIVSHDGSRVFHDKENPRVEIEIKERRNNE